MYTGEYILEITEGKIPFPDWNTKEKKKKWMVCEYISDNVKITKYMITDTKNYNECICDMKNAGENFVFLDYGDFVVDDLNRWTIPPIISDYLQGNTIYLFGNDTHISIYNEQDYKEYMEFVETILKAILKYK